MSIRASQEKTELHFARQLIFASLFFVGTAIADTQQEINHLLGFVASTTCQYERNGNVYDGARAVKHINRKYEYFKDDINSAEHFIRYSATKSTMSGKQYKIHCSNVPVQNSSDWLLDELKKYRHSKTSSSS
jgi:hypothetical protein